MVYEIQHFKVAELIFISNQNTGIVTPSERKEIKNRFESIIESFLNEHNKDHNAGYVKMGKSGLPHNSMIKIDNKRMVLNYQNTFKEPMLFVFDFEKRIVCNYINIKDASFILSDKVYKNTKTEFSYSKQLNNIFPNIQNIDCFIEFYKTKIKENENKQMTTGTKCFNISFDDFSNILE